MSDYDTLTGLLQARYSCRAFRRDPVSPTDIRAIINAARHVPSWCNAQPWQVTVTTGDATERFRNALQEAVAGGTPAPDLAPRLSRHLRRPAPGLRLAAIRSSGC